MYFLAFGFTVPPKKSETKPSPPFLRRACWEMCRITWLRPRSPATHPAMHFFQVLGLNRLGTSWHHTDMNLFNPMLHSLKRTWSGDGEVARWHGRFLRSHIIPLSRFLMTTRFPLCSIRSRCIYMHIDIQGK